MIAALPSVLPPPSLDSAGLQPLGVSDRIASFDAIRGIAAVIVVVGHILLVLPLFNDPSDYWAVELFKTWPLRLLWGGDEAVIVFFVLSGFVLTLSFLGPVLPSWRGFAAKRLLRLYPPYLVALLVTAVCAAILARPPLRDLSDFFNAVWNEPITVTQLLHGALITRDTSTINIVFWSLVHEIRISLLFPVLFLVTRRLGPVLSLALFAASSIGAIYLVVTVPMVGLFGATALTLLKTAYFMFFFVLGIVLAVYRQQLVAQLSGSWRDVRVALAIVGVGLLGLKGHLPYEAGRIGVGVGCALLLLVILATEPICRALHGFLWQWLGKISYSLYLSHAAVLYSLFHAFHGQIAAIVLMALVLPISLLVAWVLWYVVERRAIAWSRRAARIWA